jgi:hypothetical protein
VRRDEGYCLSLILAKLGVRPLEQEGTSRDQPNREQLRPAERFLEKHESNQQHQYRRRASDYERRRHPEATGVRYSVNRFPPAVATPTTTKK